MAINFSFADNVSYGTDDVNNIVRRLVGAGVAPFPSKESYSTSDLNSLTEAVVVSGVMLDGCKCNITNGDRENRISVSEGIVYFENGVTLEVDEHGFELTVQAETKGVVYAYFDTGLQLADIRFSAELPSDGLCVLLAKVNEDNTLTDARSFARSKIATLGSNVIHTVPLVFHTPTLRGTTDSSTHYLISVAEADISQFNYALITVFYSGESILAKGIFDLKESRFVLSAEPGQKARWDTSIMYDGNYSGLYYGFSVLGGKLCMTLSCYNGTSIEDYSQPASGEVIFI